MKNFFCQACGLILLAIIISIPVFSQSTPSKRIALVIGVKNYTGLPPLRNSLNDAKAITAALKEKGFQVQSLYDPKTKKDIKTSINWYFNQMRDQSGAVGVIYYAGHGMQYQGENYIIPASAVLQNPGDLEDYCIKMNTVMAVLNSATSSLNILLLDACRSLPSFTRGVEQGLTKMDAPEGSIIVFATQPGKVASDGTGSNGLFTSKLLAAVNEPDLNIGEVFQKVKREVYAESNKLQLPSVEDNSIGGDFYFTLAGTGAAKIVEQPAVPLAQTKNNSTLANKKQILTEPDKISNTRAIQEADFGSGLGKTMEIVISSQRWTNRNLSVDRFVNGDPVFHADTNEKWKKAAMNKEPAWCYYGNDSKNETIYGKLYNWYAVADPRKLCPAGWHIPSSYDDWTKLDATIKKEGATVLKSMTLWQGDGNGSDKYSFSALPGGQRFPEGSFSFIGEKGEWWSSTEFRIPQAWSFALRSDYRNTMLMQEDRGNGFSVRCIKD